MNVKKNKNKEAVSLLDEAAGVFSRGYIDALTAEGLDILEEGGRGSQLFDSSGKNYLDCFTSGASFNLGRGRKDLLETLRVAAQETDQGNFIAISEEKALLADKLASFMPGGLECSLFTVIRGEAMDAACKLARGYSGRSEIVTCEGGWFGHTGFSLSISSNNEKELYGPGIPDITTIPFGNIEAAKKWVTKKTAALVIETIQTENGCRFSGKEYYRELRKICDRTGAILIVDESQTGFGRTGARFSFERFSFEPDIAVLGEAMTGGVFPMTAIVFTETLKSFFDHHPLIHLCTFGGHNVGCRVALKAMDLYEQERPWENVRETGDLLFRKLREIAKTRSDLIKDVRGMGLLYSIILSDNETARKLCHEAGKNGFICTRGRVDERSVILRPPLTVSLDDAEGIVSIMKRIVEKM